MPVSATYRPAPRFLDLGEGFADPVEPADFPRRILRFGNQRWAERVGLGELTADEWEAHFARFEPLPDNLPAPLAQRYHGHQFRSYNPRIGDGRGFLFAQVLDTDGRLLDLATKGSGRTPWSRDGDGRLTLKGGVREVLATEMLEALGVYTSKTLSLFETGESLQRGDEPSPTRSSVMVRLGHSHIRFGTFQRFLALEEKDKIERLLDYSIQNYAPELLEESHDDTPSAFLQLVVERSAELCASWMAAGFVHGVLNTDNMNITGESFDYGPFRFLPTYDLGFTAAYFDHSGLYAYGRQPQSVLWNVARLADTLTVVTSVPALEKVLDTFNARFVHHYGRKLLARLGLLPKGDERDQDLQSACRAFLQESDVGYEQFFFDWWGGAASEERAARGPAAAHYTEPPFAAFRKLLGGYDPADASRLQDAYFSREAPETLLVDEIESIWEAIAERDSWSAFDQKIASIRSMAKAVGLALTPLEE
ncbi:MAG: YdiU family protein [Candidatus Binatia bacterium]|nr:YdiU family protein [Candidatus Binatia bacterium]